MAKLYNLARMMTATAGTSVITLSTAVSGFLTFAQAGIVDGDVISYAIRDGANSEIGTGTYTASGTTLTRTVLKSTNSDAAISLSGSAQVFITPNAADITPLGSATPLVNGAATAGTATNAAREDHVHPLDTAARTFTGTQTLVAGTTTVAPLKFQSGTNLTTPAAGALEYDGAVYYATPTANNRHVMLMEQFVQLNAAYTLTSQTAAQKLFNSTTNGALTVAVGTYEFECYFSLTSMSASSGSFGFALGGTATFTQAWWASAFKAAALATAVATQNTYNTAANVALATASTSTATGMAIITGTIRVTVAGTIIPQVSLGVAAAAIVGINSFFLLKPIGSATVTTVGNWS